MLVHGLTPILNVSNLTQSFEWFAKLGWTRCWDWGDPPSFGSVQNGTIQIFLCLDGQGCRGGPSPRFAGDDETGGTWMSWWVDSPAAVDAAHAAALAAGVTVTWPPTDEPWGVRECHVRHPDGHTFRVSASLEEE